MDRLLGIWSLCSSSLVLMSSPASPKQILGSESLHHLAPQLAPYSWQSPPLHLLANRWSSTLILYVLSSTTNTTRLGSSVRSIGAVGMRLAGESLLSFDSAFDSAYEAPYLDGAMN